VALEVSDAVVGVVVVGSVRRGTPAAVGIAVAALVEGTSQIAENGCSEAA